MRKIFIDIGCHQGYSSLCWFNTKADGPQYEYYGFECDKQNIQNIKKIMSQNKINFKLIEKAAWVNNSNQKYYYGDSKYVDGGSLFPNKKTGGITPNKFHIIPCIDLSEFIVLNFQKSDYIVLKMNCEGSEYELIPHLFKKNVFSYVNEWFVSWHQNKLDGMSLEQHTEVVALLPKNMRQNRCIGNYLK